MTITPLFCNNEKGIKSIRRGSYTCFATLVARQLNFVSEPLQQQSPEPKTDSQPWLKLIHDRYIISRYILEARQQKIVELYCKAYAERGKQDILKARNSASALGFLLFTKTLFCSDLLWRQTGTRLRTPVAINFCYYV